MSAGGRSWYAGDANQPSGNGLTCSACGKPCSALYPGDLCKKCWKEPAEPKTHKKKPAKQFSQWKLAKRANVRRVKRNKGKL